MFRIVQKSNNRFKLLFHALLPAQAGFHSGVERELLASELSVQKYEIVVVNTRHLLPWDVKAAPSFAKDRWSSIYDQYGLPRPAVIRSVALYQELERGSCLFSWRSVTSVGWSHAPAPAVVVGRAEFREPVAVTEVARALKGCDREAVFFTLRLANNTFGLPKKFFEAIHSRLGIVMGVSLEIIGFERDIDFGIVVDGWSASDIAVTIIRLSVDEINFMKQAAAKAASDFSSRGEGHQFLVAIGH